MAATLNLPMTADTQAAIQAYADDFLNPALQHSRFTDADLEWNPRVNSFTRDTYRWLYRLATDEIGMDTAELWRDWERIENALASLAPVLRYVDHLEAELRHAQRSLLGPLQAVPQAWLNAREKWYFARVVKKLWTAVTREAS